MTLQGKLNEMASQLSTIERETVARWPILTKYQFRQLLTPEQVLLWDNWQEMDLGLTQEEKWQMNSFFKSFEAAEKITMNDELMSQGMTFFVTKALITQDEADRILAGYKPGEWPPAEEEEI